MEILLAIISIAIIFGVLRFLIGSAKFIGKLVWNGIIGLIILFIFNIFGGILGLNIEPTFINALVAGVFGIPGIIVLLLLK